MTKSQHLPPIAEQTDFSVGRNSAAIKIAAKTVVKWSVAEGAKDAILGVKK